VSTSRRAGIFHALRVRDFALLWSGQSVSAIGDGIFTVALVLETLRVDHSPTGLAFVITARAIPSVVFSLVGGVIVDRVPKRLAMLAADAVRGMAVAVIALLVAKNEDTLAALIAMSAIFGTADAFFGPASMSMVPELLPDDLLVQGNALSSTTSNLASSLLGPATGGAIVGFIGLAGSFFADAVSFTVSATCLIVMAGRSRPAPSGKTKLAEAREGFAYLRSQRWLVITLVAASFANFFGIAPFAVLLPLLVRHVLHASPLTLGLVFAAGGAAGVVASLVVAHLGAPKQRVVVMWIAYGLSGVAIALMAAAPDAIVVGVLSAAEIGLIVYGDVLYVAMMQAMVPQELRGRVFSVAYLIAFVLTPIGTVIGGVAAAAFGTRTAVLLSGCLSGACALVLLIPGAREPEMVLAPAVPGDGE
jgi:MFS family permease